MFRNREVIDVRRPRALVFIFTLLLCPANSWIDQDKQREMKANVELLKREALRRTVDNLMDMVFCPLVLEKVGRLMDYNSEMLRNGRLYIPELIETHQSAKDVTLAYKGVVNKVLKNRARKIEDYKKQISQLERIMMNLEDRRSDL